MEKCMYNGNPIYAFDIIDENRIINYNLEKGYRSASKQKLLTCCGCGAIIIFKFGDLSKRRPYFSHYSSNRSEGCTYGKETEEHIQGKKLLLDHMKRSYPNIYSEMRYYIKSINRYADLYFKFDDQELVIEFQRTTLAINVFDEKIKDYKSLNINILWILSGNEVSLDTLIREYNLSFSRRSILQSFDNRLVLLNVVDGNITILSKITYKDKETNKVILDKVFYRTYLISDITINLDGTITSDFEKELNMEKENFIKEYNLQLEKEELRREPKRKERKLKKNQEYRLRQNDKEKKQNTEDLSFPNNDNMYRIHKRNIEDILRDEKQFLIPNICKAFSSNLELLDTVIKILNEKIALGNKQVGLLLKIFMSYR